MPRFSSLPWMRSVFSNSSAGSGCVPQPQPLSLARLPAPIGPEPRSVPLHDRVGLDDDGSVQQRRHEAIEPDKEQSVRCREPWLGEKPAPQQVQLMPRNTISASTRACDLKGEANTCSNKPRNETIAITRSHGQPPRGHFWTGPAAVPNSLSTEELFRALLSIGGSTPSHTQAQGEPEVRPDRLLDHRGREWVAVVADFLHPIGYRAGRETATDVTMPKQAIRVIRD